MQGEEVAEAEAVEGAAAEESPRHRAASTRR